MTISEFIRHLRSDPHSQFRFLLPNGTVIPAHAHITEVGRVEKSFMDCGGTVRRLTSCLLQVWVADDTEHRLFSGKFADIIDCAKAVLQGEDLPVEIEYEDTVTSQFPVMHAESVDGVLTFTLSTKHTDCLAKELCLPKANACTPGGGCC